MRKLFIFTIFICCFTNTQLQAANEQLLKTTDIDKIFNLKIPLKTGIISEKFKGNKNQVVILIKDTHCNLKTQKNINNLLIFITSKLPFIKSIFIEGANSKVDLSLFNAMQDTKTKEDISNFLYQKSFLSAVEFFAINSKKNYQIYGIENINAYTKNLNSFKQNMEYFNETITNLENIDEILLYLNFAIFSEDTIRFFEKEKLYNINHTIALNEYAIYLRNKAITLKIDYLSKTNFTNYLELLKYENIVNYPKIENATSNLIGILQTKVIKTDFTILLRNNLNYRLGKISADEYFYYLKELLDLYKIDYQRNLTLKNFFKYLSLKKTIIFNKLNSEIVDLETQLKEELLVTKQQKLLANLIKEYNLVKNFLNFNSLPEDITKIKSINPVFFQLKKIAIKSLLIEIYKKEKSKQVTFDPAILQKQILQTGSFYILATKRNNHLYNNLISYMQELNENYPIALLGKFHIKGISTLLKKANIPYIIIEPTLENQSISNYINIILQKKTILASDITNNHNISGTLLAPYTKLINNLTPDKTSNSFDQSIAYLYFIIKILKYSQPYQNSEKKQTIDDFEFYFKISELFKKFITKYSSGKKISKKIFLNKLRNNLLLKENSCIVEKQSIHFSLNNNIINLKKAPHIDHKNTINGYIIDSIKAEQKKNNIL
jgi:hypothetical protein